MRRFEPPKTLLNPTDFDTAPMKPLYSSFSDHKRVLNTRNPFSRLRAAYTDKFHEKYERRLNFGEYWDEARKAENKLFEIPDGYASSFHAFLRKVQLLVRHNS